MRICDGIRESAKAWMLGEYLVAPAFQNVAMRNLHTTYRGPRPRSGIGADVIEYVCENCTEESPLYRFVQDITIAYWTNKSVVEDDSQAKEAWKKLLAKLPGFRDVLLERLSA